MQNSHFYKFVRPQNLTHSHSLLTDCLFDAADLVMIGPFLDVIQTGRKLWVEVYIEIIPD